MNLKKTVITFLCIPLTCLAQETKAPKIAGIWINTQYEYYLNIEHVPTLSKLVAPRFIIIDSQGSCSIELMQEQRLKIGKPKSIVYRAGIFALKYNPDNPIWLYTMNASDSFIVYNRGEVPGAGIIFRKYK